MEENIGGTKIADLEFHNLEDEPHLISFLVSSPATLFSPYFSSSILLALPVLLLRFSLVWSLNHWLESSFPSLGRQGVNARCIQG